MAGQPASIGARAARSAPATHLLCAGIVRKRSGQPPLDRVAE